MRKYLSLIVLILTASNSYSQESTDSIGQAIPKINRWSLDLSLGNSRGIRPYNDGYFSTENTKVLGEINLNSFNIGARCYLNRYVTFKSDLAFDRFTPTDNKSAVFDVAQFRWSIQTMFNINMLFGIDEFSKFKLQPHIGLNVASLKTIKSSENQAIGSADYILGLIFGVTPSYNITSKTNLFIDFSLINNFRQHKTWDGNVSDEKNNLSGQMGNMSFGVSYKLGKPIANTEKELLKKQDEVKNNEIEKRLNDVESKLKDTDKDGVPDYLDLEISSLEGAIVDSKGIMIDKNKNNIPDEVEKYLDTTNGRTNGSGLNNNADSNNEMFKKAIDEGYICVFFETGKSIYLSSSRDAINFVQTFLITNPEAKIDLIGYTDEIGTIEENKKLGLDRANNVKETLVKLGIEPYRLKAVSAGEDQTYNPSTPETRNFDRKVVFRIK